ncbi:MAG: Crp/Fnr family transcriptional regulator [Chitinophagales bacterium]|jgi:CRP-like cAMP-binding protein
MQIEKLIAFFEHYLPLDDEEKQELINIAVEKNVKRKQFILQENDICRHYSFVVSGLFKMYIVDKNGLEHNLEFAYENEWITDIGSFHTKKPSQLYIEAIEPSIILQIEKSNLIALFTKHPKFDRMFRVIIENKYILLENRMLQNISFKAEDRYQKFIEQYASLSNRIPNNQIASYLGITPEFLSKIRNTISKK